jgi:hypothetical protein
LAHRSRKTRRPRPARQPTAAPAGYARSRAKEQEARAGLEPLAPGERPGAVTVAAVAAALLAVANVALWAAGWEVRGQDPDVRGVVLFSAIMLLAAAFMWRGAYWAVLGFQALMAIGVLFAFLALLTASNLQAVALSLAFVLACGTMFWFLVRALARLQMPRRPSRQER